MATDVRPAAELDVTAREPRELGGPQPGLDTSEKKGVIAPGTSILGFAATTGVVADALPSTNNPDVTSERHLGPGAFSPAGCDYVLTHATNEEAQP